MYAYFSTLTCVIHVSCKGATCIHQFYCFFIDVFVYMLIFYTFSFMQCNAGPMALPTDDRWQCHPNGGHYVKVDTKVIPHYQIVTLILILQGWCFIHQYCRRYACCSLSTSDQGCILGLIRGSQQKW